MFKNIHKKLVHTYPLIWNTRVLSMLSVMLICHVLFYLAGHVFVKNIRYLADHSESYRILDDFGILTFSILLISISIIIWLVFYLRNNPFKSFYPIRKTYLVKEFFITWLIFLVSITLYHSYTYGRHIRILELTKYCNPAKEVYEVNQAVRFIPFDLSQFNIHNCCDSISAREKANSKQNLHQPAVGCDGIALNSYEGSTLSSSYLPERYDVGNMPTSTDSSSYLYFCEEPMMLTRYEGATGTAQERNYYQSIANKWLLNNERDSVRYYLQQYQRIINQYQLKSYVDIDTLTAWCFQYPGHAVMHTVSSSSSPEGDIAYPAGSPEANEQARLESEGHYPSNPDDFYFENNSLRSVIQEVYEERQESFWTISKWFAYLYVSLGLAILLFMFRITRLKPWIASVIGVGIWSILIALAAQLSDNAVPYYLNFLVLLFLILASLFIGNKVTKLLAAIWLNWFAFSFLMFIPFGFEIIKQNTYAIWECVNNVRVLVRPEYPIYSWINDHWDIINAINIASGALIMVFVIIPLAYKWQSNPSE
jgi:hypothetical protein